MLSQKLALNSPATNISLNPSINDRRCLRFRSKWESFRKKSKLQKINPCIMLQMHLETKLNNYYHKKNNISNTIDGINSNINTNISQNENPSSSQNQPSLNKNKSPVNDFKRIRASHFGKQKTENLLKSA